jgi:hypothetical protein
MMGFFGMGLMIGGLIVGSGPVFALGTVLLLVHIDRVRQANDKDEFDS